MAPRRAVADVDYRGYTVDPDEFDDLDPGSLRAASCPPIGPLREPEDMPPAPLVTDTDEPLVRPEHRGIRLLAPYFHEGWRHARPDTWIRAGVAERLGTVADALPHGFGLAIFDAWRPLALQAELFDAAYGDDRLPPGFIADPDPDPTTPPAHLTGGAVDLTLTWHSAPLALGTAFDDFTARAAADALEPQAGRSRELRRLLVAAMRSEGFIVLDIEWWHFEWGTRRWAALRGERCRYGAVAAP